MEADISRFVRAFLQEILAESQRIVGAPPPPNFREETLLDLPDPLGGDAVNADRLVILAEDDRVADSG